MSLPVGLIIPLLVFSTAFPVPLDSAVIPNASHHAINHSSYYSQCDPWVEKKCVINQRPIIGILAQELSHNTNNGTNGYIAASYVKWVESAGARAVPILINQPHEYYKTLFTSINGILFPGGAAPLTDSGYAKAGQLLFRLAANANAEGIYFPIWGTCLGFEFMSIVYSNKPEILTLCSGENASLALDFQPGVESSRLFGSAPRDILRFLTKENTTANSHHFCVTVEDFIKNNLTDRMRLLSKSTTDKGENFVSSAEDIRYPFYGVQFHPEKSNFEWKLNAAVSHSADSVAVSQYFANFFVGEARKNSHQFPNKESEENALIYNWNPIFSGKTTSVFDQIYLFK